MGEGEALKLLPRRLDQLRIAIAERGAPQTGHALDIASALVVEDADAFPPRNDRGTSVAEARNFGIRMHQTGDVALLRGVKRRHQSISGGFGLFRRRQVKHG